MENGEIYTESIGKLIQETDDINFEIRRLDQDNKNMTLVNCQKIRDLQKDLTKTIDTIKDTLEKSGKEAILTYCGWAHFRQLKDMLVLAEGTLEEIEEKYPETADRYIKISKSLKKEPIKKDLKEGIIALINATTIPQGKKFEFKFTGVK